VSPGLQLLAPSFRAACRAEKAAEKPMGIVILRSQQATKNLKLLENANADPSRLLRMTASIGFSAAGKARRDITNVEVHA
jgi:hypothetical protein